MRRERRWQAGLAAGLWMLMTSGPLEAQEQPDAAQEAQPAAQEEEVLELSGVTVVGSRLQGRSAQDSAVPVDVIAREDLQTYGIRDMDDLLAATVPSYNVNQQPIADAATLIRPANLRGLPPDSTLVLVNGKRRHRASVIAEFGGVSNGSHGSDISAIPAIALERIEVLRDGAAAQYGSDAIAGILNFRLREDTRGLTVQTMLGQTYHGDGDRIQVAANLGVPLTDHGFANFSFEFLNADETSRSAQRADARGLIEAGNMAVRRPATQIWGAPEIQYDYKFFGNLGLDLEAIDARVYAFGNYAERMVEGGFFFRNPNTRGGIFDGGNETLKVADLSGTGAGCPTIPINPAADYGAALAGLPAHCFAFNEKFPGGFTPRYGGVVEDWSVTFGLRGQVESASALLDGWFYDASASFGENRVDFFMHDTVNPQLAARVRHFRHSGDRARTHRGAARRGRGPVRLGRDCRYPEFPAARGHARADGPDHAGPDLPRRRRPDSGRRQPRRAADGPRFRQLQLRVPERGRDEPQRPARRRTRADRGRQHGGAPAGNADLGRARDPVRL